MQEFCITWKIDNFSLCVNKKNGAATSPNIVTHILGNTIWYLNMNPYGKDDIYVACYLIRWDCDGLKNNDIEINFSFSLVLADGSEHLLKTFENKIFLPKTKFGCNDLKLRDDILKEKCNYLPNDILTIRCYMRSYKSVQVSQFNEALNSITHYLYDEKPEAQTNLSEMYSATHNMLKNIKNELSLYPKSCIVRRKLRVEKKSLIWRLKNFNSLKKQKIFLSCISSSVLRPSLFLTLYLDDAIADEYIQIEIRLKEISSSAIVLKCDVTVLNYKDIRCDFTTGQYFYDSNKKDQVWKLPLTIKNTELINDNTSYLKNGTLSLLCEFTMSDGKSVSQIEETDYCSTELEGKNETTEILKTKDYFSTLMAEAKLLDFVNIIIGKTEIIAHKKILSARSPIFKAMFNHDMIEKENGTVNVTDIDVDTFKRMLTYMYGGTVADLQCENAAKLYSAADKYQCLDLKDFCSSFLMKNLSIVNVCDVLAMADMHQDQELTASAHEFILHHVSATLRSKEWKIFMDTKPELACKMLYKIGLMHKDA